MDTLRNWVGIWPWERGLGPGLGLHGKASGANTCPNLTHCGGQNLL